MKTESDEAEFYTEGERIKHNIGKLEAECGNIETKLRIAGVAVPERPKAPTFDARVTHRAGEGGCIEPVQSDPDIRTDYLHHEELLSAHVVTLRDLAAKVSEAPSLPAPSASPQTQTPRSDADLIKGLRTLFTPKQTATEKLLQQEGVATLEELAEKRRTERESKGYPRSQTFKGVHAAREYRPPSADKKPRL